MDDSGLRVVASGPAVSVEAVDALIARVQRLIDSRPDDPFAWNVEASFLGDIPAIAALAAIAAASEER